MKLFGTRFVIIFISFILVRCIVCSSDEDYSEEDYDEDRPRSRRLSTPQECARSCQVGEPPRTCYYNFTVEYYATLGRACDLCPGNSPARLVNDCQCITTDGYEMSGIITANRMYPGPAIIVCRNDYIVVDVANHIPGNAITIHWHGIFQKGYPYYDGVPHVTQCPIDEGSTFRYQFKAQNSGTHFWHAHSGLHKADGLEGSLIVREPKSIEPNGRLWDFDRPEHVIFLTDWLHDSVDDHYPGTYDRRPGQFPDSFLINGMGQWTDPATNKSTNAPLARFTVKRNRRYRFRMINSCSFACPVQMTIEGHSLRVIASDGEPVLPVVVTSITSFSAERYDFVLETNQPAGSYWIQVRGFGECEGSQMQQLGILQYETAPTAVNPNRPTFSVGLNKGVVLNELNVRCDGQANATNVVCVSQLKNFNEVPKAILKKTPDIRLYMPFGFYDYPREEIYKPGTYNKYIVAGGNATVAHIGNITNKFPPVSMISQRHEIPNDQVCDISNKGRICTGPRPCECTHIQEVPLNSVVEVILVDEAQIPGLSHPFHLHGHAFYVMGEGCGEDYNITSIDVDQAKYLDSHGQMKRNWKRPPAKDTFAVPNNGFSIIRFLANNPGYWLFHCHFLVHLSAGMGAVFHVGKHSDLPPIPKGFPRCGNFLPPIEHH